MSKIRRGGILGGLNTRESYSGEQARSEAPRRFTIMQTYSVEAAKADFVALLHRAEHGEAVLITEHDKPIARLGPPPLSAQTYRERIRSLRGATRGIDTTVERDQDRV